MTYKHILVLLFLAWLLLPEEDIVRVGTFLRNFSNRMQTRTELLRSSKQNYQTARKSTTNIPEPLTLEKVKKAIDDNGVKFKWVVLAQAVHETNYFKSNIFKQNRNCFGMKLSQRGWAIEENKGHAKYDDVALSCQDYAAYQAKYTFSGKETRIRHRY
jgi:uncharacterized FlgJ-related protein